MSWAESTPPAVLTRWLCAPTTHPTTLASLGGHLACRPGGLASSSSVCSSPHRSASRSALRRLSPVRRQPSRRWWPRSAWVVHCLRDGKRRPPSPPCVPSVPSVRASRRSLGYGEGLRTSLRPSIRSGSEPGRIASPDAARVGGAGSAAPTASSSSTTFSPLRGISSSSAAIMSAK